MKARTSLARFGGTLGVAGVGGRDEDAAVEPWMVYSGVGGALLSGELLSGTGV